MRAPFLITIALALAAPAQADPVVLRYAAIAPDGTAWAREVKAYARAVQEEGHGQVALKLYLGGIAGDEAAVPGRIRKGQLDGELATVTCERFGPSLKVLRVPGLFRRREEALYVLDRLRPTVEAEFRKNGFALLGLTWVGSDVIFSREPVRNLEDLRRLKLWIWELDQVWVDSLKGLGIQAVPLPLDQAARAYDEGRIDGFLALPTAALVFQWSARARYFTNLPLAAMSACNLVANSVFDGLPLEAQSALKAAAARLNYRFADVSAVQEDTLLLRVFEKQGLRPQRVAESFRIAFLDAARTARASVPESLVPPQLLSQVLIWLSDYRAVHP